MMDINEDPAGLWLGCGKGGFCVSESGRIRCLVRPVYAIINIFVFLVSLLASHTLFWEQPPLRTAKSGN